MRGSKVLLLVASMATLAGITAYGGDVEDLQQAMRELRATVTQQQAEINRLKAEKHEVVTDDQVVLALDRLGFAQVKDAPGTVALSKQSDKLTITGDLRLRYERIEGDMDAPAEDMTQDRFRTRFRIGLTWDVADGWVIGAGLATGGAGATSTNDTWSDAAPFETGDIRLDYAYAMHEFETEGSDLVVVLGQQKNPFTTSFLVWDSDVRPIGAALVAKSGGLTGTFGALDFVDLGVDEDNILLFGAQAAIEGKLGDDADAKLALAYYTTNGAVDDVVPAGAKGELEYDLGDVYAEVKTTAGDVGLTGFAQYTVNFGADGDLGQGILADATLDAGDEDTSFVLGVQAKLNSWTASWSYAEVEENGLVPMLKDANFAMPAGTATDLKGHKLALAYGVTKNMSVGLTVHLLDRLENDDAAGANNEGTLYQFDIGYKF